MLTPLSSGVSTAVLTPSTGTVSTCSNSVYCRVVQVGREDQATQKNSLGQKYPKFFSLGQKYPNFLFGPKIAQNFFFGPQIPQKISSGQIFSSPRAKFFSSYQGSRKQCSNSVLTPLLGQVLAHVLTPLMDQVLEHGAPKRRCKRFNVKTKTLAGYVIRLRILRFPL